MNKFIKPEELEKLFDEKHLTIDIRGLEFNLLPENGKVK